jgi:hypothetical protein
VKRSLFNAGAAVSLMLCVAIVALWARSYFRSDVIKAALGRFEIYSASEPGLAVADLELNEGPSCRWRHKAYRYPSFPPDHAAANLVRFRFTPHGSDTDPELALAIPYWVPATASLVLPVWWTRRRRSGEGESQCCPACGYDLRGGEGEMCPECGATREANA